MSKKSQAQINVPEQKSFNIARNGSAILLTIAVVIYANTLGHGFVLDDIAVITSNKFVQQGVSGIPDILTTFYWKGFWASNAGLFRPLSLISFALEWQIMPNNAFIHHFFNVAFYVLCIWLMYRFLQKLTTGQNPWIPFLITLLFVVHPVHTEVVANTKSRDEIFCLLFFLIGANLLLENGEFSLKRKLLLAGSFFLALLSKESAILFVPVFVLLLMLFKQQTIKEALKTLIPVFVVSVVWLAYHQWVILSSTDVRLVYTYHDNSLVACDGKLAQIATGMGILLRYIGKLLWPSHLAYDYSFPCIPCEGLLSPLFWLAIIAAGAALTVAWKSLKSNPLLSFGILFFFITIALTTNVFALIGTTMGDRLLFSPSFGFCIVAVVGVFALIKSQENKEKLGNAGWILLIVAVVFAGKTWSRNGDWKTQDLLFARDVKNSPGSARIHFNAGTVQMKRLTGNELIDKPILDSIAQSFNTCLMLDSGEAQAYVNMAVIQYKLKNYPLSIQMTRKALSFPGYDTTVYANLADALLKNGELDSAIFYYRKVIASKKDTLNTYNFMGAALFSQKKYSEAIEAFSYGIKRFGGDAEIWTNLGNAYGASGNYAESIKALEQSLILNPSNRQTLYFLAISYANMGNKVKSDEYLNRYNAMGR